MLLGIAPSAESIAQDPQKVNAFLASIGADGTPSRLLHEAYFDLNRGDYVSAREKLETLAGKFPDDLDVLINLGLVDFAARRFDLVRRVLQRALGKSFTTWSQGSAAALMRLVPGLFHGTHDHQLAFAVVCFAEELERRQGRAQEAIAGWKALLKWHEFADIDAARAALSPFVNTGNPLLINIDPGRLEYRLLTSQVLERAGEKLRADQMALCAAKEFGVAVESREKPAQPPVRVVLLGTPDHSGFSWLTRALMEVGLLIDRPARPALRFVGSTTHGEIFEYPPGVYEWHAPALFRGLFCFDPSVLAYHIQRHVPISYAKGKKALFMVRDPRDQMLSKYHWYGLSRTSISIPEFCAYRTEPLIQYLERIVDYPEKAVVFFEDFKKDATTLFDRILSYLEFENSSREERQAALHWASTKTMGKWEDIAHQLGRITEPFDVGRRLIRDGSAGQHHNAHEAQEALEKVRERCAPAYAALEPFRLKV